MTLGKVSAVARVPLRRARNSVSAMHADVRDARLPATGGMRIMLVHDRPESELTRALAREGHNVLALSDGSAARRLLGVFKPELILIVADDPATVCLDLRLAAPDTPIVAIAHRDSAGERISALEAGADDCLGRPFHRQELIARMRAAHRRVQLTMRTARAEHAERAVSS